jgi:hypothetical protein
MAKRLVSQHEFHSGGVPYRVLIFKTGDLYWGQWQCLKTKRWETVQGAYPSSEAALYDIQRLAEIALSKSNK